MSTDILLAAAKTAEQIEHAARYILAGMAIDTGDDAVIDRVIEIARAENIPIRLVSATGKAFDVEQAYRLRFERGLSIR